MLRYIDIHFLLVFLVVFLLMYLYWIMFLPKNFPPGPWRLPIFGNLVLVVKNPGKMHMVAKDLIKRYGPVVGLKFGSYPVIMLSGLDVIREAFVKQADVFSDRPSWMFYLRRSNGINGRIHGLIFQNGELWKNIRRFTLMSLRDFGVGKQSIEEKIQEEAGTLCKELRRLVGQSTDISTLLQEAVSNIICSICFGSRFQYDDPEFLKLMKLLDKNVSSAVFLVPVNFIPLLQLTPNQCGLREVCDNVSKIIAFIHKKIQEHRKSFHPGRVRDFVDLYLKYEFDGGNDNSFTIHDIEFVISNLFAAGTETTSTSLRWLLLYMMHYPEVQEKCHQELDTVIGSERRPCLSDRANMPYTMATIQEMQRLVTIGPLGLPHSVKQSTSLCGYSIPKNTIVFASLESVHMDPNYWEVPEEFLPERWIGPDGKLEKKEAFMPFSVGPRICIGEMLAKYELFIFFTSLMQKFELRMVDHEHLPSLEGRLGITFSPVPYEANIIQRLS